MRFFGLTPHEQPDPKEAKRRAKRENERIKLTATFVNGTGIAVLLTIAILPSFKAFGAHPEPLSPVQALVGVSMAIGFHVFGLWILRLWRRRGMTGEMVLWGGMLVASLLLVLHARHRGAKLDREMGITRED